MGMWISSSEKQTTLTPQPIGHEVIFTRNILSYRPVNTRCPLNVGDRLIQNNIKTCSTQWPSKTARGDNKAVAAIKPYNEAWA